MKNSIIIRFDHKDHKSGTKNPNKSLIEVIIGALDNYSRNHYDSWEIVDIKSMEEQLKEINNDKLL